MAERRAPTFESHIMEPHGMDAADRALAQILTFGARVDPLAIKYRVANFADSHEAEIAARSSDEHEQHNHHDVRPARQCPRTSAWNHSDSDSINPSVQAQRETGLDTAGTRHWHGDVSESLDEWLREEGERWGGPELKKDGKEGGENLSLWQKFLQRRKSHQ